MAEPHLTKFTLAQAFVFARLSAKKPITKLYKSLISTIKRYY